MSWLDNPAVQGGLAPLVVGLAVAGMLRAMDRSGSTSLAWLAVLAGYATMIALATGFDLTPLTATRKIMIVTFAAAIAGIALDLAARRSRALTTTLAALAALSAIWCFWSIISQRQGTAALGMALGVAAAAAAAVVLVLRIADDGVRTGATGVGFGVATGVGAVLSASIGFLLAAVSIAAACGALLLVQVLGRRDIPAGHTGALSIAVPCTLFALGACLLAEMPWFVVALLFVVPLFFNAVALTHLARMPRASVLVGAALLVALLPIAAAWYAARASLS
jgi:hypothetical protein